MRRTGFISLRYGHVLYAQQDEVLLLTFERQSACLKFHFSAANLWEFVLNFEIREARILRQNLLQQRAQTGNVPLPVAQRINLPAERFLRRYLEVPIKGLVGRLNALDRVQQQGG